MEELEQKPETEETPSPATTGEGGTEGASMPEDPAQRLEEARKAADGYKDQLLRKAAEFENFKRRTEAEYLSLIRSANEGVLVSLIPVVEDIARSLRSVPEEESTTSFVKGVELIEQKLIKVLEQHGLRPFESFGKPFDVNYHDALLQVPRDDVPPGTVVEEVERGYMLLDKVLRHAKVVVSSGADGTARGNSEETPRA